MLPIFNRMMNRDEPMTRSDGVTCIVVLPTRELVLQSYETAVKLTRAATNIVACALTGGQSRKSEKARLRKGVHILLGTPGRLIDHLEKTDSLKEMENLETVVLDEADRMLEMGYLEKIKHVFTLCKERAPDGKKIQSILLSATLRYSILLILLLSKWHLVFLTSIRFSRSFSSMGHFVRQRGISFSCEGFLLFLRRT